MGSWWYVIHFWPCLRNLFSITNIFFSLVQWLFSAKPVQLPALHYLWLKWYWHVVIRLQNPLHSLAHWDFGLQNTYAPNFTCRVHVPCSNWQWMQYPCRSNYQMILFFSFMDCTIHKIKENIPVLHPLDSDCYDQLFLDRFCNGLIIFVKKIHFWKCQEVTNGRTN